MSGVHLNIALSSSLSHCLLLFLVHTFLFVAVIAVPLSSRLQAVFLLMLFAHGIWTCFSLRKEREITRLMVEYEQVTFVCGGRLRVVDEVTPLLITAWLMILDLKCHGKVHRLTLWNDSADAQSLRRLRVWLLCGGWRQERA